QASDLPAHMVEQASSLPGRSEGAGSERVMSALEEAERAKLREALDACGGILAQAAKRLGITPRQIGYKIKKYGLAGPTGKANPQR
ncbi:MAG: helix-turn-helix domain-containing protein, partial [bacterium]|nr:helix-turn-helix domain-containing protein [bacterium]